MPHFRSLPPSHTRAYNRLNCVAYFLSFARSVVDGRTWLRAATRAFCLHSNSNCRYPPISRSLPIACRALPPKGKSDLGGETSPAVASLFAAAASAQAGVSLFAKQGAAGKPSSPQSGPATAKYSPTLGGKKKSNGPAASPLSLDGPALGAAAAATSSGSNLMKVHSSGSPPQGSSSGAASSSASTTVLSAAQLSAQFQAAQNNRFVLCWSSCS